LYVYNYFINVSIYSCVILILILFCSFIYYSTIWTYGISNSPLYFKNLYKIIKTKCCLMGNCSIIITLEFDVIFLILWQELIVFMLTITFFYISSLIVLSLVKSNNYFAISITFLISSFLFSFNFITKYLINC
jgi:hypothetical protein